MILLRCEQAGARNRAPTQNPCGINFENSYALGIGRALNKLITPSSSAAII